MFNAARCNTSHVLVKDLARHLGASFEGNGDLDVKGAATLEDATASDLAFLARAKALAVSHAGCLLVGLDFASTHSAGAIIRVKEPRLAMAQAIAALYPPKRTQAGVHASAVVDTTASIHATASIGPHVSVEAGAVIGKDSIIGPGCSIGAGTRIGDDCVLHARVTLYAGATIGNHVILHSGCVIGADGFGYVMYEGAWRNFPQIGRVEIADRVEIGANSCVDRAALGVTYIGEGSKLDNMVHVGHNCRIGKHVVVAAQTGFSGGVVIGDYAVIGGQVGVGDKARIESRAVIGSGSGVLTSKVVRAGDVMWGTPARPLKQHLRQLAALSRLAKKEKANE